MGEAGTETAEVDNEMVVNHTTDVGFEVGEEDETDMKVVAGAVDAADIEGESWEAKEVLRLAFRSGKVD